MAQGKLKVKTKLPQKAKSKPKQKGSAVTKRNSNFNVILYQNLLKSLFQIVQINRKKLNVKKRKN